VKRGRKPPKDRSIKKKKTEDVIADEDHAPCQESRQDPDVIPSIEETPTPGCSSDPMMTPIKKKIRRTLLNKQELKSSSGPVKCPRCEYKFMPTKEERKKLKREDFVGEIISSDKSCFRYTGVTCVVLLKKIFDWLHPAAKNVKLWKGQGTNTSGLSKLRPRTAMTLWDEFLLTLVRIRRGYDSINIYTPTNRSMACSEQCFDR
jgi:hypothetical protein